MNKTDFMVEQAAFAQTIFDDVRALSQDELGVSRQGYGPVESEVIQYLCALVKTWGLDIHTDLAGNVWLTKPGQRRDLPAVVSGSHADSVPQGGNYDGLAGIVAALTVMHWLCTHHVQLERDYRVLVMRCEESSYFGKAYVGSLAMMGALSADDLALKHRDGTMTLAQAMQSCGVDTNRVRSGQPVIDTHQIKCFFELHIEQGPMLEQRADCRVGIVTGIRGNIRHKSVRCWGETAHSGAVDKAYRHDALMATVELIHLMNEHWDAFLAQGKDLVFTVGIMKTAKTAAIAVIPGETEFSIDMRSVSAEVLEEFHELLLTEARHIEEKLGVRFEWDARIDTAPAHLDESLQQTLSTVAHESGIACTAMPSGAGHDAAVFSRFGIPSAMIFVANQNGSHNHKEAMQIDDFLQGCEILRNAVLKECN